MCNIKTMSGASLRTDYTAFEIAIFKYIDAEGIEEGTTFLTTSMSGYSEKSAIEIVVLAHTEVGIKFRRMDTKAVKECALKSATAATTATAATAATTATAATAATAVTDIDQDPEVMEAMKALEALKAKKKAAKEAAEKAAKEAAEKAAKEAAEKAAKEAAEKAAKEGKHKKFAQVLLACKGHKIPYLYGPAGTGKSTLCAQVAKELGVPFYSVSSLQNKYELEGFIDAKGEYVSTVLFECMKKGGVFLFDEADTTAGEVCVAFNSLLANGFYTFPGVGRVDQPENCYFIMAGNTKGQGGDSCYSSRYKLDQSTLDRLAFIRCEYDLVIELKIAKGDHELVDFCYILRQLIKTSGLPYTVSPRFIDRFVYFTENGINEVESMEMSLLGGWNNEDVLQLSGSLGDSKYELIFKKYAAIINKY